MRFSLRRLNCRWLKPINGAGKIGRVRDLWYFSLSSLGLGLRLGLGFSLSGETIFSGKIGLGRNLWCCWEKLVAPEIFDIFSISSLGLGLDLSGKNLSPPKSLIFFPQQCSMSCCQQLYISQRVKINMTEEDVQCTLSTSRGLILKAFGRSTNKMETCVSLQLAPDALPPSSRKRKKATPPFSDWKSWRLTLLLDKHIDFSKWTLQSEVAPFLGKPRRKFSNMKTILQPYWCQF